MNKKEILDKLEKNEIDVLELIDILNKKDEYNLI